MLLQEKVWLVQATGMPISDAVREAYVASYMTRNQFDLDALVHDIAEEATALQCLLESQLRRRMNNEE